MVSFSTALSGVDSTSLKEIIEGATEVVGDSKSSKRVCKLALSVSVSVKSDEEGLVPCDVNVEVFITAFSSTSLSCCFSLSASLDVVEDDGERLS